VDSLRRRARHGRCGSYADANVHANVHADPHVDADQHTDAYADGNSYTDGNPYAHNHANGHRHADKFAVANAKPKPHAGDTPAVRAFDRQDHPVIRVSGGAFVEPVRLTNAPQKYNWQSHLPVL
jgi:hypothetical protein